jgi:hemerythrin-like domain-containing protein
MDQDPDSKNNERRRFLQRIISGSAIVLASCTTVSPQLRGDSKDASVSPKEEEEVSPAEDLMREHGVLKRILLIYGEALRRIETNEELPPQALLNSSKIIRSFIEDYHEKLEEDFLFPRFRKARQLVDLVDVLNDQHRAGRRLTDTTLKFSTSKALKNPQERRNLAESLRLFIRMYNPHEAREDTVLFPAFRELVSSNEYNALGEDFEKREHALFGDNGFEAMVARVAAIEKTLGIFNLAQFTPKE